MTDTWSKIPVILDINLHIRISEVSGRGVVDKSEMGILDNQEFLKGFILTCNQWMYYIKFSEDSAVPPEMY